MGGGPALSGQLLLLLLEHQLLPLQESSSAGSMRLLSVQFGSVASWLETEDDRSPINRSYRYEWRIGVELTSNCRFKNSPCKTEPSFRGEKNFNSSLYNRFASCMIEIEMWKTETDAN